MFARLRDWLFGRGATENLPERVREAIRQQQDRSEILIGWAELVLVGLLAVAYALVRERKPQRIVEVG
ncbi:MAG: hypothetical protein QOG78_1275, partial [Rhodospirillaceae bacterium]|nr:hypothetical protein [Rhodospirillaceae bacterium]